MTREILLDGQPGRYRATNIARAELSKITTLRSTAITAGLAVVASLLVTGLVAHAALHHFAAWYHRLRPDARVADRHGDGGPGWGRLRGNARDGGIPERNHPNHPRGRTQTTHALRHQTGRHRGLTIIFCEVLSFASFYLGQAVLSSGHAPTASLASSGAFRAVTMTGLVIALLALMSFGFGMIFRSTAAAIAAFVGVVFVLPLVIHGISEAAVKHLPTNILTQSAMSTVSAGPGGGPNLPLAPGVGLALMVLYAAVAVSVGAVLFVRRDA